MLMPEEVWFVSCLVGLVIWSVFWGVKLERPLSDRLVSAARGSSGRAAAVAFGVQAGALTGFLLAWLLGAAIASVPADVRWAAVTLIPAMLLYGPVSMTALPTPFGGFSPVRRTLRASGASRQVARSAAWAGGAAALIGWVCVFVAIETITSADR